MFGTLKSLYCFLFVFGRFKVIFQITLYPSVPRNLYIRLILISGHKRGMKFCNSCPHHSTTFIKDKVKQCEISATLTEAYMFVN